jgi:chemotaxis protein CheC
VSLAEVLHGAGSELFDLSYGAEEAVLFLYINFSVNLRDVHGYIAMLMDMSALASLKRLIQELIRRIASEGNAADVTC